MKDEKKQPCSSFGFSPIIGGGLRTNNGSEMEDIDISLLQRPLRTAFTGFQEARRAFEDGTEEVKRLLMRECSLIYECNVCRNMFRSLPNFISHKRVFCSILSAGNHNGYLDQNSTVIIQAPTPNIDSVKRSRSTGSSPIPTENRPVRGSIRDLSKVIERLRREQAPSVAFVENDKTTVLQLESVPNNNHAMYQTVKRQEGDSIKTEVNEVHNLMTNVQTLLGPDGKAVTKHAYEGQPFSAIGPPNNITENKTLLAKTVCEICDLAFQTEKTLKVHIQKHHSSSSYVFQCPACSLTFMQPAAVIRHLSKEHKKPTRRIRLMRDKIFKRRIQQSDVQVKGPSRELKRLQMNDVAGNAAAACAEAGTHRKVMSTCIYCEKSFERRAALSTHLLNCKAKQEALQKPPPPVKRAKYKHQYESISEDEVSEHNLLRNMEHTVAGNKTNTNNIVNAEIKLTYNDENKAVADTKHVAKTKAEADAKSVAVVDNESNSNLLHRMFADLGAAQVFNNNIQTVSFDKFDTLEIESLSAEGDDELNGKEPDADNKAKDDKSNKKKTRNVPMEKQLKCRCKICNKQFNELSNLRRHISMFHYRARRFGCKLCEYRAFRRYDIVNHLGFVHKMEGEREVLTCEYVATYDCKYSKNDVDGDILLLEENVAQTCIEPTMNDDSMPPTKFKVFKTYEKRLKHKKSAVQDDLHVPKKSSYGRTKNKLRHSRLTDNCSEQDAEKRPIRKRFKAENKDFVYDYPHLGKDQTPNGIGNVMDRQRRRFNSCDSDSNQYLPKSWPPFITETNKKCVHGFTRRLVLQLVSQGLAVSSTLPELPAERPQIRPRLTSIARNESAGNIIETVTEDEILRPKSKILNEAFIEKIVKRTAAACIGNKNKLPELKPQININNLLRKVDQQFQPCKPIDATPSTIAPKQIYQSELLNDYELQYSTPNGKHCTVSRSKTPEPPRKCNTVQIEHLAESTFDSLLRTTLHN